jgi:hypothetical protein
MVSLQSHPLGLDPRHATPRLQTQCYERRPRGFEGALDSGRTGAVLCILSEAPNLGPCGNRGLAGSTGWPPGGPGLSSAPSWRSQLTHPPPGIDRTRGPPGEVQAPALPA